MILMLALTWLSISISQHGVTSSYFLDPEFLICDGTKLRRFRRNFCQAKLVFQANFTKVNSDCLCVTGVWLILSRDCVPSVIVAHEGCLISPQIKAMQFMGTYGKGDFFAVVSKTKYQADYELMRPAKIRNVDGFVWIYNGIVNASEFGTYCAQKSPKRIQKLKGYKKVARYTLQGKLSVQWECSEMYKFEVEPNLEYGVVATDKGNSECKIDCSEKPRSRLLNKRKVSDDDFYAYNTIIRIPTKGPKRLPPKPKPTKKKKKKNKDGWIRKISIPNNPETPEETTPAPQKKSRTKPRLHEGLGNQLNNRLLQKVSNFAFPQPSNPQEEEYYPKQSFKILEKILYIVGKVCGEKVPRRFLKHAIIYFKALYKVRGTNLLEYLSEEEASEILQFLNGCYGQVKPIEWEDVEGVLSCKDRTTFFMLHNGSWLSFNESLLHQESFYLTKRHLTLEIPWNIIDLTVGTCIDSFAQSYILYHKMEQALERLFLKDLRTLWKLPPMNDKFYRRLHGPYWHHRIESLEKCVEAVYFQKPKLERLRRPDEVISGKGRGIGVKQLQIPRILKSQGQRKAELMGETIVASSHLSCETFDIIQCQEQIRPRGWS